MANKDTARDRTLGMDRAIDRRDFLNGVAVGAGGLAAAAMMSGCAHRGGAAGASGSGDYPPARTGLRGSHAGAFETAHSVRDGTFRAAEMRDADGEYDLV